MALHWRQPHLPPLLRGLGTLLLLVTSLAVGVSEYRQAAEAPAARDQAWQRLGAAAGEGGATLAGEVRLLRLQMQESDLAGQVFENPWFQLLGALGTLLISASFFVEAAQRRPQAGPVDPQA